MLTLLRRPASPARHDGRTAARPPRRRHGSETSRFFAGVLLAVPLGMLLWLLILHATRMVLPFG
jgi:hypothetical protein